LPRSESINPEANESVLSLAENPECRLDLVGPNPSLMHRSGVKGWRLHDLRRTCVSGMARLGVAPHVADKILNHQSGTISGVAAVYQRHEFLAERKEALDRWGAHVDGIVAAALAKGQNSLRKVA
jgi:hypothetical protein